MIKLNKDQKIGEEIFHDWYVNKGYLNKPILRQGGVAGTGKSSFLKYIIDKYKFNSTNSMVMTYTGQASNILREKKIMSNTIHSSLMEVVEEYLYDHNGDRVTRNGIPVTIERYKPITHISPNIKIIFIDEASFLPKELEDLASSFGIPVYELGDPLQLPPVIGQQCFNMDNLDHIFTEPMRQNLNSEIYKLSMLIRNYERIKISEYNNEVLFIKQKSTIDKTFIEYQNLFKYSNMIITTTNKQRQAMNDLYRSIVLNTDSKYPIKGDRMICRHNNRRMTMGDFYLANGTQGTCQYTVARSSIDTKNSLYFMDFHPDFNTDNDDYFDNLICDSDYLLEPISSSKRPSKYNIGNKFEYSYAITAHLSQGSQASVVSFLDGGTGGDSEYKMRLKYTAITRAQKKLFYFL